MGLFDQIVSSTRTQGEIDSEKKKSEEVHLKACIKERVDFIISQIVDKLKEAAHNGERSISFAPSYRYETADSWACGSFRDVSNIDSTLRPFSFLLMQELKRTYDDDRWGAIPYVYQHIIVENICEFLEKEGFKDFLVEFNHRHKGYVNGKLKVVSKCKYWTELYVTIKW